MPLLSIPHELLLDIIGHVVDSAPLTTSYSFNGLKQLAHTCIVLRSLSITLIYASVTIRREAGQLGSLLVDYPHIATCVRRLKIEAPRIWAGDNQRLLRCILERCTRLRELVLEKLPGTGGLRTGFEDETLEYLPVESRRSMKTVAIHGLPLDGLLVHFRRMLGGEFSALQTLKMRSCDMCNPYDVRRHREEQRQFMNAILLHASAEPPGALKSVQSFLFDAPFPYRLVEESDVGACLANAMPNLKFLSMVTSPDIIYGALSAYISLGSKLTELNLTGSYPSSSSSCSTRTNPQTNTLPRPHFCDIITKLSRNLTKFIIHGNSELRICHTLFISDPGSRAENWPNLDVLNIRCLLGCEGIKPSVLRLGLKHLARNRPGAVLLVEGRFHEKLISWNTRSPEVHNTYGVVLADDVIASPDVFQRLNPPLQPPPPSDEGRVVSSDPANWSFWGPPTGNYEGTKAPW